MATLTETAYYTRRGVVWGARILAVLIILRILLGVASFVKNTLLPASPAKPTVTFGKLPPPAFPEKEKPQLEFVLQTIEGVVPELPEIGRVYFIPQPAPNLLALDRAQDQAERMGFGGEPVALSSSHYRWQEGLRTLDMDITNGNFTLRYNYRANPNILAAGPPPYNEAAENEAKGYLRQLRLLDQDLEGGRVVHKYYRYVPPNIVPVLSLSEADFIRVNLFRADLDEIPILSPNPEEGLISFLFSGARDEGKILEANYTYSPVSQDNFATYPLRSSAQAWDELQAGEGYIASLGQTQGRRIIIRQIYLAYFEPETAENFLQPIIVFEGDNGFFAYVAAVAPEWLE